MSAFSSIRPTLRLASTTSQAARSFSSTSQRSVARMIITGRLGADPELQTTASGQEIIKYSVGSSHGRGDNRQTSWFRVASFAAEGGQRDYIMGLQKGYVMLSRSRCAWFSELIETMLALCLNYRVQMANIVREVPSSMLKATPTSAATKMLKARSRVL